VGSICSGRRGWRGGKLPAAALPAVRLTFAALWSSQGTRRPSIDFHYANSTATIEWQRQVWLVSIAETHLHRGGTRRWLVCPECSARRQALYVCDHRLACRACLRLRYESQHENRRQRMLRRADKLRVRLGWPAGVLSPDRGRPLRMRVATYQRIVRELVSIEGALLGDCRRIIEALQRRP
jgi:hypothetical protein